MAILATRALAFFPHRALPATIESMIIENTASPLNPTANDHG
jgi:hypothetical protein